MTSSEEFCDWIPVTFRGSTRRNNFRKTQHRLDVVIAPAFGCSVETNIKKDHSGVSLQLWGRSILTATQLEVYCSQRSKAEYGEG